MSGEDIANAVIIEIFAGTSRVTACLRQLGLRSCFGVDHVKVKNLPGPVSVADLTKPEGIALLMSWINTRAVLGIFLAPPCGAASRARSIKLTGNQEILSESITVNLDHYEVIVSPMEYQDLVG